MDDAIRAMSDSTLTGKLWCTGPRTSIRTRTCHAEQCPTPQVSYYYHTGTPLQMQHNEKLSYLFFGKAIFDTYPYLVGTGETLKEA